VSGQETGVRHQAEVPRRSGSADAEPVRDGRRPPRTERQQSDDPQAKRIGQ
jgi:hypothetical protein